MIAYSYIRFSTPDQEKGDSRRRQTAAAEAYCKERGLVLDDQLKMEDRGISAFHGKHRTKGVLGQFLEKVKSKEILPGSILIVESLDRLSREQISDALTQFLNIINAGIKLVTLTDNVEYTKENINANIGPLFASISIMCRANEESETKSKRLAQAWDAKRAKIDKKKLTSRCPAWLRLNRSKTAFEIIPGRDEVIKTIFQMKLAGSGPSLIAKTLNETCEWLPPNGWRESYVVKILRFSAVIGEYQPHKMVEGKRVAVGPVIADYFPEVVSKDVYNAVQQIHGRGKNAGGRTGKATNIFAHLVKCGSCGGSMVLIDHGNAPRSGGKRLVCDMARRKANDCERYTIKYELFEQKMLDCVSGLTVKDLVPSHDDLTSTIDTKRQQIMALNGEETNIEQQIENIIDSIANTSVAQLRAALEKRSEALFARQEEIRFELTEIQKEISQLESLENDAEERIQSVKDLFKHMNETEEADQIAIRLKLRERLKRILKKVVVYRHGKDGRGGREIMFEYLAQATQRRRTRFYWPEEK
jgi:DNA invertase Pin-like site-specific DNA recombinase